MKRYPKLTINSTNYSLLPDTFFALICFSLIETRMITGSIFRFPSHSLFFSWRGTKRLASTGRPALLGRWQKPHLLTGSHLQEGALDSQYLKRIKTKKKQPWAQPWRQWSPKKIKKHPKVAKNAKPTIFASQRPLHNRLVETRNLVCTDEGQLELGSFFTSGV